MKELSLDLLKEGSLKQGGIKMVYWQGKGGSGK